MTPPRLNLLLLHAIFFASGLAGLGYQIVWARRFAAGLGHEMPALLAVVSAFLAGMALGAWVLSRRIATSERPGRWYAGLEFVIGGWGFLSVPLIPWLGEVATTWIGVSPAPGWHGLVAFALPFFALLPATAAMGATLPAMEKFVAPFARDGRCLGGLYAANTLGAVAGTLGGAYALMPALGFRGTTLVLATLNVLCGVLVEQASRLPAKASRPRNRSSEGETPSLAGGTPAPLPGRWATLFLTGLLGIGYEVAGVRVLSQVLENTVFTFAVVLAVYLAGTALGAALYQRACVRRCTLADGFAALAGACLLGVMVLGQAQPFYEWARAAFGDSPTGVFAAEMILALAVFGLPTVLMGAMFSHLAQTAAARPGGVGLAVAVNTLGGALAAVLFNVLLFPMLGGKWTLVLLALGYLPLALPMRGKRAFVLAMPLALLPFLPANLRVVAVPPGGRLVEYRDGVMASVAVVEGPDAHRVLRVDNRFQMGGTAAALAQRRQGHLPLLLHPAPRRALFLGLGTGQTLAAGEAHPGLEADGVELVPEVAELRRHFGWPEGAARLRVFTADARRFVRASGPSYDVIVADVFHPARDGAAALYTREHFQAVRGRLAADGLFCQWLPLHQLEPATLRVIVRTFLEVFPDTRAHLLHFNVDIPVLGLVGAMQLRRYPADWLERRGDAAFQQQMKAAGLKDAMNLLGTFAADADALRTFAANADVNTDDHPVVLFRAPRVTYQRAARSGESLFSLLSRAADVATLLETPGSPEAQRFAGHLRDFLAARDVYLRGLEKEARGELAAAIEDYLDSARTSLYFTPGYARCVSIISVMVKTAPAEARKLYERLLAAQPQQPLGRQMLGPQFERGE